LDSFILVDENVGASTLPHVLHADDEDRITDFENMESELPHTVSHTLAVDII
jgi:hypothetical protein